MVAIISGGCVSGDCGAGVPPVGTLLEQYAYEPYGTVLAADNLDVDQFGVTRHAVNRVGFQGLFFERYDGSYFEPSIAPGVAGMYYARNRFYSPALGRFLQRDPNETGIPIIAALVMNGQATSILMGGFGASALYADGMNVYLFARANPVNWRDPSGLFSLLETLETASLQLAVWGMNFAAMHGTAMQFVGGVVAAANLYMMVVDPDYQAMVMAQPDAMGVIEANVWAIAKAGGAIKGLLRAPAAIAALAVRNGFSLFEEAQAYLAVMFPGRSQVGVTTSLGRRVIDLVSRGRAFECKMGYVSWNSHILEQIRKDAEILREGTRELGKIGSYEWHFFRSANTGKVGADERVLSELYKAGIQAVVHE